MKFLSTPIPGGRVEIRSPLGSKIADRNEVDRIEAEIEAEMESRLGRPPTAAERISGPRATDDRTLDQKMEFDGWQPKRTDAPHAMDTLADSLSEPEKPDYSGMSLRERLAHDARRMAARDQQGDDTKARRIAPDLKMLDREIDSENWRAERGSQRIVDLLTLLKRQIAEGSDGTETKRLNSLVNELRTERTKTETAAQRAAIATHERAIAAINRGEVTLSGDDPVKWRAQELMAEGQDPTSAYYQARNEASDPATADNA